MDDKEILIRQSILMEEMGKRVIDMEGKVNKIYDIQIGITASELAVHKEKIGRLEKIVYGLITIIAVQVISIILLWIQPKH
jgi:cell division protein FtsL